MLELKAKMGMLPSASAPESKQLGAPSASSLTEEDLKELEDLDLSSLDVPEGSTGKASSGKTEG